MLLCKKSQFWLEISDYGIFEGDIMLNNNEFNEESRFGSMDDAITKKSLLWDVINGIVIIHFTEDNNLSHDEREKIQQAITDYHSKTCVR